MPRFFAWLLLLLLPLTACAQAPAGPPQVGVDYDVLKEGQRWQRAPGHPLVEELQQAVEDVCRQLGERA